MFGDRVYKIVHHLESTALVLLGQHNMVEQQAMGVPTEMSEFYKIFQVPRSAIILVAMMNEIFPFMNFTIELGEDFVDGKLPSLDTKIWMVDGWKVMFEFFEKTMATNLIVEAGSALSREVKLSTLSQVWN